MAIERIDRKELQHDAFRDAVFEFIDYMYQRRLKFVLGGIAVFVVVAGAIGGYAYVVHTERVDSEALLQAVRVLNDPATGQEARRKSAAPAFHAFVEQHPRSSLAPVAWLYIARLAYEQTQLEPAAQAFQHVLDNGKTPPLLRTQALVGLAKVKEAQGKPAEAAPLYEQIGAGFQDLKQLYLGRAALAAGKVKEAREHFLQAAGEQGYTGITTQAREALDYLP
jgi:predicted negative regulator of RcsB-dependent stress response